MRQQIRTLRDQFGQRAGKPGFVLHGAAPAPAVIRCNSGQPFVLKVDDSHGGSPNPGKFR